MQTITRTIRPAALAAQLNLRLLVLGLLLIACDNSSTGPEPGGLTVTGVSVTAPTNDVATSSTLQLTATVQPANAPQSVTWLSSDEMVATVDASGLVTGIVSGPVTITATSTADPTKSKSLALNVVASACPEPRTIQGGTVSADQTWENWVLPPECVDYQIVGQGLTNESYLITIEPGVRATFEATRSLVVRGDAAGLRAVGTAAQPIILTGLNATRGSWGSVSLQGTKHPENRIEHVTIEYGGAGNFSGSLTDGNLMLTGDTETTLQNVTLRESASYGLSMANSAVLRAHGQNTFTANTEGPAHVNASQAHFLDTTSTASGNDVDLVGIAANDIVTAVTWVPMGDGYLIEKESDAYAFDVRGADAFLTLEPGVRIVFQEDMAMTVADGAGIAALGTSAAPVVLTGAQPTRGFWRGFRTFSDNPNQRFDQVVVEYGGGDTHSGSVQPGNVFLDEDAVLRISNSALREGAGYGLVALGGALLPAFNGNVLSGNVLGAAHVRANVAADLTAASTYIGNGRDVIDIYAYVSRITVPTTWEDLGVPYVITDTPNGLYVDDVAFTVEEGTEILFQGDVGLSIEGGTLAFQGTQQNPIRVAGDGGAWKGIQVFNSSATFSYTTIEGAGASSWGSVQPAGAVTINAASNASSSAAFGTGTSHTGTVGGLGIVFGPGSTMANCSGSMQPVHIPTGDQPSDHCG